MAVYNNTLVISRPSTNMATTQCVSTTCADLGHADPLNKDKLGPRPNREKVRQQIRDYILHMLGAPVLRIELDEQNIDFCIDQALKIVEEYAPREFFSYYTFSTVAGRSVYELPPDVGYVRRVAYRETANFAFQASDLGGVVPIEYYAGGGGGMATAGGMYTPNFPIWGHAGEWVLYKQYEQMYSRMSSQLGGWEWVGGYEHIKLYPAPCGGQTVIVHYIQRNKDWHEVTEAMQEGALSYAKEIIGRIRSKYPAPPGPGGGMQLDGMQLLGEAKEEREKWKEQLLTRWGDILPITMG
jgi:hypothetical protein